MTARDPGRLAGGSRVIAFVGVGFLVLVIGAALLADVLAQHPPDRSSGPPYARPSADHLLGTDDLGRDLFAQLVFGARVSLLVGLVAAVVAVVVGTTVALLAGWYRGWVDAALMRLVDIVLSVPLLVLVLVLAAYFGRGLGVLIALIAGVLWARPARLLRSQVLKLREYGHVVAADSMGAGTARIVTVHLLRRLVPLLLSQFVRAASVAVLIQAGVAFLGLGDPSRVSWGSTLYFANNGSAILTDAWLWWIVPPGVALAVLILGLAFVGFAIEEWADPRVSGHGWRPPLRRPLPQPAAPCPEGAALCVRGLRVAYGDVTVVDDVDLTVQTGRSLGIVGESGCGKSTLAMALIGLLPGNGRITGGEIVLRERDLRRLGRDGLRRLRGREVAVVPQAAMSLLDPTMAIHRQVAESAALVDAPTSSAARATDALERVGLPAHRHRAVPHELSGGERQRVVIAMAIVNGPSLLIADEPTTGLDVVTQASILGLLDALRCDLALDVILISHDLRLVAGSADDLAIMYAGRIVEAGTTAGVLAAPEHPYTEALIAAFPSLGADARPPATIPGDPPQPGEQVTGCAFAPRCARPIERCTVEEPVLVTIGSRSVACHCAHRPDQELTGAAP